MTVVAIIGLGYVGLPLAIEFGKKFDTIGYDSAEEKVAAYKNCRDPSGDVAPEEFEAAQKLFITNDPASLERADFLIIAVPTPVNKAHQPDFDPLLSASGTVGRHMKRGATVVYESTVYPGATEEICIPALERASELQWRRDFHVGYSPERINPGDREHTLTRVIKIVAGDDEATGQSISKLYASVIHAGVHKVSSIKIAEAAKVIENTQRDLNIALVNELAIIFKHIGIDTQEVLSAAGTKWNFLPFRPGLVGGHCIGVDPYYLTHKAEMMGYHPQVILAGRRINDGMGKYVAEQTVKLMVKNKGFAKKQIVNVLGLTFKENCPDLRNSKVVDIINELRAYGLTVNVHDPVAVPSDAKKEHGVNLLAWDDLPIADAVIVAVAHTELVSRPISDIASKVDSGGCVIDVKSQLDAVALKERGLILWRL